jgi:hypothetical protein
MTKKRESLSNACSQVELKEAMTKWKVVSNVPERGY